ncbi:MAG: sulfurtransferase [Planctomycetales bacterium]
MIDFGIPRPLGGLASVFLLTAAGLMAGCGPKPAEEKQQEEQQQPAPARQAARIGRPLPMLVSVDELESRIGEANLRILDARAVDEYVEGHVPQAVPVEVGEWKDQSLAEKGLQDQAFWSEAVSLLGIDGATNVVVYADDPTAAARVWWTLKYVGVPHVALLDGGWPAWRAAGGKVATDETEIESKGKFAARFQKERLAEIGDLKESLEADAVTVIDARSDEEHAGTSGPGARLGRIPGAKHLEWKQFLDADGRFKSPEQIRSILAEQGIAGEKTVVTHCQSGGRAALDAFALELAGLPNVKNYYCGWSEWSKDEAAPVEK